MPAHPAIQGTEPFEHVYCSGAAECVTKSNAAEAPRKCDCDCRSELEFSAMHGDSGEHQNGLVGNQRSDDAEHQEAKNREITVIREKLIDVFQTAAPLIA